MKTYYYLRKDNSFDENFQTFLELGADPEEIFFDHRFDKKKEGSQYNKMKSLSPECVVVPSITTLGATAQEIYKEISWFLSNGIRLSITQIPDTLDSSTVDISNRTLQYVYHDLAAREHTRQKASRGTTNVGRPSMVYPPNWAELYEKWVKKEKKTKNLIEESGLPRSSFYKLVKQYELEMAMKEATDPSEDN